jgi:hypothetical protein
MPISYLYMASAMRERAGLPVRNVQFDTTDSHHDLPIAENLLNRSIVTAIALTAHGATNAMLIQ